MKRILVAFVLALLAFALAADTLYAAAGDKPPRHKGKFNVMRIAGTNPHGEEVYYFDNATDGSLNESEPLNGMQFNWISITHLGAGGTHFVELYGPSAVNYDGWSDTKDEDFSIVYIEEGDTVLISGHVWYGINVDTNPATVGTILIFAGWDRGLEK